MINQAITNILKNAGEAIEARKLKETRKDEKGIINVAGMDLPMVIHGVQHVFHPPEILDKWPDEDRATRVVIIARDFDQEQIAACFNGFGLPVDKAADA